MLVWISCGGNFEWIFAFSFFWVYIRSAREPTIYTAFLSKPTVKSNSHLIDTNSDPKQMSIIKQIVIGGNFHILDTTTATKF